VKSRVTFILLFMLLFSIAHDSIINVIDENEILSVSHYADDSTSISKSNKVDDIHDIHNMFHFIAIMSSSQYLAIFDKKQILLTSLIRFSLPHYNNYQKPPII